MAQRDYQQGERSRTRAVPEARRGVQGARVQPERVESNYAQDALNGLLGIVSEGAQQQFKADAQEEYLNGVRAQMEGMAFEEIDSNVLTRSFVRGGYQDQDYRAKQAAFVSDMKKYLSTEEGASSSPEEFMERMRGESRGVVEGMGNGLTTQGRADALQSQTAAEASLVAAHTDAYQNYSLQQAAKRYTVQGNQIIDDLVASRAGGQSEQVANATRAVGYFEQVMQSDGLPAEMRQQVAQQYVGALLSSDQHEIVESMRDNGMFNEMSFEDRQKMDGQIREAKNRTKAVDGLSHYEGSARFKQDVLEGRVSDVTDVRAFVQQEVSEGRMSPSEAENMYKSYYKSASDQETQGAVFDALNRGDVEGLNRLGVEVPEAFAALDTQLGQQGVSLSERARLGIQYGMNIGHIPKHVGTKMESAVNAMANPDGMNPDQVAVVNDVMAEVQRQSKTNPAAGQMLLQAMPESTRGIVSAMLVGAEEGRDPQETARTAMANSERWKQQTELAKQTQGKEFREAVSARVDDEFETGFFGQQFRELTGQARNSNNPWNLQNMRLEVEAEASRLARDPNNLGILGGGEDGQKALLNMAVANVKSRTITVGKDGWFRNDTAESNLVLPRGVTAQQFFGTTNTGVVGNILAEQYPPAAKGYTTSFRVNPSTGTLENIQLNEQGMVESFTPVDPKKVGAEANGRQEAILKDQRDSRFGTRVTQSTPDGDASLDIDGLNSVALPKRDVMQWRKDLIGDEGIRLTAYKDTTGHTTVGAGANVEGHMQPGDKISEQQASAMFRERSDAALLAASGFARKLGVQDNGAKLALAGAAYQLGATGLGEFKTTSEAIKNRDWDGFQTAVKNSLWYKQTPKRVNKFIQGMKPHFER